MNWKENKWKILLPLLLAAVLAGAFFLGGTAADGDGMPKQDFQSSQQEELSAQDAPAPQQLPEEDAKSDEDGNKEDAAEGKQDQDSPAQKPQERPDRKEKPAAPQTSKPSEPDQPQKPENGKAEYTCTISISCATILNNMDSLDGGKKDLVPADGWILAPMKVSFSEGESVFDVLRRTCMEQKLHMEFEDTPLYDSAYIEGIGNLYEFDCGALSGWEYAVNDWFPNYGCSRYTLKDGDVIEWLYTCDLGADIGAPVGSKAA